MNSRRRVNSTVRQLLDLSTMKPERIHKIAAIFPSLLVSLVHFTLSVRIAPTANVIFQRQFDTGLVPTGTDALIVNVDAFLSRPIPALLFAGLSLTLSMNSDDLPERWANKN